MKRKFHSPKNKISYLFSFLVIFNLFFLSRVNAQDLSNTAHTEKWLKETDDSLVIQTENYQIILNKANGDLKQIISAASKKPLIISAASLWRIDFVDGSSLKSSDFPLPEAKFNYTVQSNPRRLILDYEHPIASMRFSLEFNNFWVDLSVEILKSQKIITRIHFPNEWQFEESNLNYFYLPLFLGLRFTKTAFKEQWKWVKNKQVYHYPQQANFNMDFIHIDSKYGLISLYGIRNNNHIFVPADWHINNDIGNTSKLSHTFITYTNEPHWQTPTLRLEFNTPVFNSLFNYKQANQLSGRISHKIKDTSLRNSYLNSPTFWYTGESFEELAKYVEHFPKNMVFGLEEWMNGGFSYWNPDIFPPNPKLGGDEAFLRLINKAKTHGWLIRPYTDFTWWHMHHPESALKRLGTEAMVYKQDGQAMALSYLPNKTPFGYQTSPAHPLIVKMHDETIDKLYLTYQSDVAYHDQADRTWLYDFNPQNPYPPYGYAQAMLDLIKRDYNQGRIVETEFGLDYQIPYVTGFNFWTQKDCGWNHDTKDYQEFYPLLPIIAHGEVVMIDSVVFNRRTLSLSVLLGVKLRTNAAAKTIAEPEKMEWIRWIALMQEYVNSRLIVEPLADFKYESKWRMKATYGQFKVWANFENSPWVISNEIKIAPNGFYCRSDKGDLEAGILLVDDTKGRQKEFWQIRIIENNKAQTFELKNHERILANISEKRYKGASH